MIFKKYSFWILYILIGSISFDANSSQLPQENSASVVEEESISEHEYSHEEVTKAINDASVEAKKNEANAKKSLIEANKIIKASNSTEMVEIAKNRAIIEQSRKDIAKLQIELADIIKQKNTELNTVFLAIKEIGEAFQQSKNSVPDLEKLYIDISNYWRSLVDSSLEIFSNENLTFDINLEKSLASLALVPEGIDNHELVEDYQNSYQLLQKEYDNIVKLKSELKTANKNYQANILLKSGKLRADIFQQILVIDKEFIKYDNQYAEDLLREIKLIPYRPLLFFYSKILEYKKIASSGFIGVVHIVKQVGLLLLLITLLVISGNILNRLIALLKGFGQFCAKKSLDNNAYKRIALFISKLIPYFRWIVLIVIFTLIDVILTNSLIAELHVLVPYFQYYFLYKIFVIFAYYNLNSLVYRNVVSTVSRDALNLKIKETTKLLGVYLLSSISLLHLTQTIVRKVYFYNLAINLFWLGLWIILSLITARWQGEIKTIAQKRLPSSFNGVLEKLFLNNKRSVLFSPIIFCILVAQGVYQRLMALLQSHDFSKNILSQIYRRKLESVAKKIESSELDLLDDSYITEFLAAEDEKELILTKSYCYSEIQEVISNWKSEVTEENSIAIYGEQGIGKSKLISQLVNDCQDVKVIRTVIKNKITSHEEFLKLIAKLFDCDFEKGSLLKFLANYEQKTIIILENSHNLFLAKEGGFKALKTFLNFLVKIDNPNLLWISSFHYHSWSYLQNALKIDNYFRFCFKLSKWSDENIRELIIDKHNKTNFKLVYDPLIFAIDINNSEKEFEDLQLKFFQIIWSQSRGNPKIAVNLWFSSLHQYGTNAIKVSLPKVPKASQLSHLSDETLFVYGAIAKHSSLSVSELSDILLVAREEVINIVRIGLEKKHLIESEINRKRYKISYDWQIVINQLLINRNFIYAE